MTDDRERVVDVDGLGSDLERGGGALVGETDRVGINSRGSECCCFIPQFWTCLPS